MKVKIEFEFDVDATHMDSLLDKGIALMDKINLQGQTPETKADPAPAPAPKPAPVPKPKAKPAPEAKADPAPAPAPAPAPKPAPAPASGEVTITDLRALLATKVENHRPEIKAKLTELGAANVTTLDPQKYGAFKDYLNSLD